MERELNWVIVISVLKTIIGVVERTQVPQLTMSGVLISILVPPWAASIRTTTNMS